MDKSTTATLENTATITRRNFFRLLGGGVAVVVSQSCIYGWADSPAVGKDLTVDDDSIAAWIHIHEDGKVSVFTGKVEVGQNIRTSLAQVVAEELFVSIQRITMIMGDTLMTPYDAGTFGSRSIPYMGPQLRKAAASLRKALLEKAAKALKVPVESLRTEAGEIVHDASNSTLPYGSLTRGEKLLLPIDEEVALIAADSWTVAGTSVPKVNGHDFVTGKHQYTSDMALPDMVYGKILRAPAYGMTLVAADIEKARTIPGVTVVEAGDFIGVVAPDPQMATNALAAISVQWDASPQPSKADIFSYLKENAQQGREDDGTQRETRRVFDASENRLEHRVEVQYIAHVPLEPRAAVAQWDGSQLTVWTGTQRPFGVQEELAGAFSVAKEQVRVIMPDTGSAYGGKHSGEAAVEAARLAKAVGKAVKVVWTREEEFKWAYFRPAGLIEVAAALDSDGSIASWEFHNYNSGNAGIDFPYRARTKHIQYHPSRTPLKQGSYRGLAATANVFAIECMMDDLARQLRVDPLDFRLRQLTDERMQAVLETAAERFGWKEAKAAGHGFGIACGFVKNSYIATCAEVAYDRSDEQLHVIRLVAAYDCGAIVNPKHLENQVLGAILQGLGGALFEEIDFRDGRILNPTLSSYRVPRFSDIPPLDIVLIGRKDVPSAGAGETPIVGTAPAIRNAIADATGIKLHKLPMIPQGLKNN
ncbi:xanthine dehydrogenase family protein molybdopterin-binding subunit [Parapedobacter koreensis]|uniref:Isoquinoline 1-oxidoreductase n=1 Tax=Parapedobacter koreensis TaxID=332977 RepID=A0A1H7MPT9_9SPHI|nr:molybdopterin cofactor-binding domain-containing protein [Parapedobacter koreensis]SEL13131.1 isoquinoline 1-oxidoreductase [Parapedobacter koreensis]